MSIPFTGTGGLFIHVGRHGGLLNSAKAFMNPAPSTNTVPSAGPIGQRRRPPMGSTGFNGATARESWKMFPTGGTGVQPNKLQWSHGSDAVEDQLREGFFQPAELPSTEPRL